MISTLGTGSSSTVYLAEHIKLKVYRAIKCIPKNTALNTSIFSAEQLLKEAELLKNLNHPGIPLIYDIDEDDNFVYMIEEFIQGDSLEDFILHQEPIPEEFLILYGIQLCAILDYLHHLSPYPILYQDLKPEHIILCGNQIKLIDFGIASFITAFGNNFQTYGTDGFVSPEALLGKTINAASDIYALGKVLSLLADACTPNCSEKLTHIIKKASADDVSYRYQSAADLMLELSKFSAEKSLQKNFFLRRTFEKRHSACQSFSHLIKNIAVIGSRPGAGATHFSVSLTSILNQNHIACCYVSMECSDSLACMIQTGFPLKETEGIYHFQNFTAVPCYGPGVENPVSSNTIQIRDFGSHINEYLDFGHFDITFVILSGSPWDIADSIALVHRLKTTTPLIYICGHGDKHASQKYARYLFAPVYCFPNDTNPFRATAEKERLILQILQRKEMTHFAGHWKKRFKSQTHHRDYRL